MPRFDGRGPDGEGPMTGWGQGNCGPNRASQGASPYDGPSSRVSGYGRASARGGAFSRVRGFFGGFKSGTGRGRRAGRGSGRRMGFRGPSR